MAQKRPPRIWADRLCPVLKGPCREDCVWCYIDIDFTEDGLKEEAQCAVAWTPDLLARALYSDYEGYDG